MGLLDRFADKEPVIPNPQLLSDDITEFEMINARLNTIERIVKEPIKISPEMLAVVKETIRQEVKYEMAEDLTPALQKLFDGLLQRTEAERASLTKNIGVLQNSVKELRVNAIRDDLAEVIESNNELIERVDKVYELLNKPAEEKEALKAEIASLKAKLAHMKNLIGNVETAVDAPVPQTATQKDTEIENTDTDAQMQKNLPIPMTPLGFDRQAKRDFLIGKFEKALLTMEKDKKSFGRIRSGIKNFNCRTPQELEVFEEVAKIYDAKFEYTKPKHEQD